jgi:hypothetical protein
MEKQAAARHLAAALDSSSGTVGDPGGTRKVTIGSGDPHVILDALDALGALGIPADLETLHPRDRGTAGQAAALSRGTRTRRTCSKCSP